MGRTAVSLAPFGASPTAHPVGCEEQVTTRIPTFGLVSAFLSAALVLPASAVAASGDGGQAAPSPGSSGPVDPSFALSVRHSLFLGKAVRISGTARDAAGKTIQVQRRDASGAWIAVASAPADAGGAFSTVWRPDAAGQFVVRAVVAGVQASDAGAASPSSTVTVYEPGIATWYGPGFYGKRTACGERLTRTLLGVANRHLPCGTSVAVSYRGHSIVVPVVDRGPFARNAQWDLTGAAAKRLGMTMTSRIGALPLVPSTQPPVL
jgi:rare lipoprotein A